MSKTKSKIRIGSARLSPEDLGAKITRHIFELGDEPDRPCSRIQFMSGSYMHEREQGGMNEGALAKYIAQLLTEMQES